jgi:hypothetical protein
MPSMVATHSISSAKSAISSSFGWPAIGVDVLAEQGHFAHPLRRQSGDFGQDVIKGRLISSPRV